MAKKYDLETVRQAAAGHCPDDLIGQRFGRLVVASYSGRLRGIHRYHCLCDCGAKTVVWRPGLLQRTTKSCGCKKRDHLQAMATSHGLSATSEYNIWEHMVQRCCNPKNDRYADYGGRGISVCARWRHSFEAFLFDVGPRPSTRHSIGRRDNDGNYEPDNCRWEVPKQQQRNMRSNHLIAWRGETRCVSEWAEVLEMNVGTLAARLRRGWPIERALGEPVNA